MSAIFVIGMGRSGTSVATRLLEIAGAFVGTEDHLLGGNESNPLGHWEDVRYLSINDRLLNAYGGCYWNPPIFPDRWVDDEPVKALLGEAEALLEDNFAPHPMWAVKDPR